MRSLTKTLLATAALVASVILAPALYAHDAEGSGEHNGSMMGSDMMGSDMMGMMTQMNEMMDDCNAMMQGAMKDGGEKPNEQWRQDAPATSGTNG